MKIEAGKKYRTEYGEIVTAANPREVNVFWDSSGDLCFMRTADLTEVVEIPERWVNEYGTGRNITHASRELADVAAGDVSEKRLGVWHLKSNGTGEFIATP